MLKFKRKKVKVVPVDDGREVLSTGRDYSLENLLALAESIDGECSDYIVTPDGFDTFISDNVFKAELNGFQSYHFGRFAFSQLCTKFGIPVRYAQNLLKGDERLQELLVTNMEELRYHYKDSLLLRTYRDKIRGVLSTRYAKFDTKEIILQCIPLKELNNDKLVVRQYHISDERFCMRVVNKRPLPCRTEKDLFVGVQIDSSDIGRNSLTVQPIIFKQVCTNGLILPKIEGRSFTSKHYGRTALSFKEKLGNVLNAVFMYDDEFAAGIDRLNSIALGNREQYQRAYFNEKLGFNDKEIDSVVEIMRRNYDETPFGLINALTEKAQEYTLDRRILIEKAAGEIFEREMRFK